MGYPSVSPHTHTHTHTQSINTETKQLHAIIKIQKYLVNTLIAVLNVTALTLNVH